LFNFPSISSSLVSEFYESCFVVARFIGRFHNFPPFVESLPGLPELGQGGLPREPTARVGQGEAGRDFQSGIFAIDSSSPENPGTEKITEITTLRPPRSLAGRQNTGRAAGNILNSTTLEFLVYPLGKNIPDHGIVGQTPFVSDDLNLMQKSGVYF